MQAAKATEAASAVKAEKFFLKAVDMSWKLRYNKDVERRGDNMDKPETKEAPKELLEILVEHPELAERIMITIKPSKLIQGKPTEQ